MKVARILAPVHSLGPGERVCLWTQGCKKNCKGCISPEMQLQVGKNIEEASLGEVIKQAALARQCRGLTISGGDPFEQEEALFALLKFVRPAFDDILVYTGYELSELLAGTAGNEGKECLKYIDVLIDGRYIDEKNTRDCVLRGSSNQKIHFLNDSLRDEYEKYMKKGRVLESFVHGENTIITGIISKEEKP